MNLFYILLYTPILFFYHQMEKSFVGDDSCQWSSRYRFVVALASVLSPAGLLVIPVLLVYSLCHFVIKAPTSHLIRDLQTSQLQLSEINVNRNEREISDLANGDDENNQKV